MIRPGNSETGSLSEWDGPRQVCFACRSPRSAIYTSTSPDQRVWSVRGVQPKHRGQGCMGQRVGISELKNWGRIWRAGERCKPSTMVHPHVAPLLVTRQQL